MQLGFIGLGRMGREMVLHLLEEGVDVVAYNRSQEKVDELTAQIQNSKFKIQNSGRLYKAKSVEELVRQLESPRIVWIMVEHGRPVDEVIKKLLEAGLEKGDIVIDGGNTFYKDSIRRYNYLIERHINFLDVGTSGGLEGARNGACLMIGGDEQVVKRLNLLWDRLSGEARLRQGSGGLGSWAYFGPPGAGHFVKMVHNGVEYGMLQAIGEGFAILAKGPYKLDYQKVAKNWNSGSVVRGWLMELLEKAFKNDPKLDRVPGVIGGGSTGEWTVETAKELRVEVPVIRESLMARKKSQKKPTFSGKVVAALRYQFGGHEVGSRK